MKLKRLENSANKAILILRKNKLKSGLFFMINSDQLPPDECYLEYPDGFITRVVLSRKHNDFKPLEKYSLKESDEIRKKFKLA